MAVAGAPMIPVHMGIMTPTPTVLVPTSVPVVSKPAVPRKEVALLRIKENDENSGPTTTVFVGNISEKASDMLIRQLLAVRGSGRLIKLPQICTTPHMGCLLSWENLQKLCETIFWVWKS